MTLALRSCKRFDVINLTQQLSRDYGAILQQHSQWLYCSLHTTAGFLRPSLCARFGYRQDALRQFIGVFQKIFPAGGGYGHDRLHLRTDLNDAQRLIEPKNGDSHLIFMSAGLSNCTVVSHRSGAPVFLLELDGVNGTEHRTRRTAVVGYDNEIVVHQTRVRLPIEARYPWAVNLYDSQYGLLPHVEDQVRQAGVEMGRVDIALAPSESHAGLTVNEYEPLLMQHDLLSVLRKPFRFLAAASGRGIDGLLQAMRDQLHGLGLSPSGVERLAARLLQRPKSRFFDMQRKIRLLVSQGGIVQGTYQRPILVQWMDRQPETREFDIRITQFA